MLIKSAILECIGSLAICFFGAFSRINNQGDDYTTIALTYFFLFSALTYSFVHISGAHFNPFLTLGLIFTGQISIAKGIMNITGQLAGSLLGGLLVFFICKSGEDKNQYYGLPAFNDDGSYFLQMALESAGIFILTYVYCSVVLNIKTPKYIIGVAAGGIYAASVLSFGHLTGGAISFIQVFGPAMVIGKLQAIFNFAIAHFIGACLSAAIFAVLLKEQANLLENDEEDDEISNVKEISSSFKEEKESLKGK
jgi:aquaporin NIP